MASLTGDIENRVRKLPKPSNSTQALQPLFEAVSNAVFGIEDRFKQEVSAGRVSIDIKGLNDLSKVQVAVTDNGIGLDEARFKAFCVLDTDFKRKRGGKGVGRLFWLDAFEHIKVESAFESDGKITFRAFEFILRNAEQIVEVEPSAELRRSGSTGTVVTFRGLRSAEYRDYFPKRVDGFLRYFSAHFIADFLLGQGPTVTILIDGHSAEYPREVAELVVGEPLSAGPTQHPEFKELSLVGFTCKREASTGLDGEHQLHLLANGRTVETRKIDNLLGLSAIQRDGHDDLVFHACISSPYLDLRVNEGRTAFNIPEKTLKDLSRKCVEMVKEIMIPEQVAEYIEHRRARYDNFVSRYPIYNFDAPDEQLRRVPFHAVDPEDFAAGLVKYQIRRDEERQDALDDILKKLEGAESLPDSLGDAIVRAAEGIQASERLALAQHVVRRKLVLQILEKLIRRFRAKAGTRDVYQLEKTLHSLIVPMYVRGDDPDERRSRAHDLWIIDERLAFTRAFASDKRLDHLLKNSTSGDRPDLFIWDYSVGMGVTDPTSGDHLDTSKPLSKVMIVEFKRPMRTEYAKAEDQVEAQIVKYLGQLKGGEVEGFERERIRVADDCVFHCFVVADIVGDLEEQLSSWETTANGQGRMRALRGRYQGSIEVIQWQDLVNDAWLRNMATLHAAGLGRSSQ